MRKRKTTGGRLNLKRMSEAMRKVTGKGRKKRAGPDRPKEKRLMPRRPKPGGRFQPKPRPGERGNPGGRFQPKPRPGDRMVLPPRPRKNPRPKLPKATMELTPEQRRRLMQLLKRTPNTARKKKLLNRIRRM
jgi:hypothetical protein